MSICPNAPVIRSVNKWKQIGSIDYPKSGRTRSGGCSKNIATVAFFAGDEN